MLWRYLLEFCYSGFADENEFTRRDETMGLKLQLMQGTLGKIYQFTKFAMQGIPPNAIASVDVTNACNLRCHHCYFFEHEQPDNLSVERWRNFFDQLKAEGFPFFSCSWVGGEPLLRKDL